MFSRLRLKQIVLLVFVFISVGLFATEPKGNVEIQAYKISPIFYAGEKNQPALLVRVKTEKNGVVLKGLTFSFGSSVRSGTSAVTLFVTGNRQYFSPNSRGNAKPKSIATLNRTGRTVTATLDENLSLGDNFFWLAFDVVPTVRGGTKLDADCVSAVLANPEHVATIVKSAGIPGVVYWFRERIAPYVRDSFLIEWNKDQFTAETMKLVTDIFFFEMNALPDASLREAKRFTEGVDKLKRLRGKDNRIKIMFGIVNANGLRQIALSAVLRRKFAKNVLEKLRKYELDGVDIDWEYPTTHTERENFAMLIATMRREFAGEGKIITVAANPEYHMLPIEVCDQADFVNIMCYDRGGEHSTMNHLKNELASCRRMGIPNSKIVMGLPFYSCNSEGKRNWDSQNGYTGILSMLPKGKFSAATNTYRHKNGEMHFFNGQKLIQEKARYVLAQKSGGVMIWAYDTDVPLKDSRSLGKALGGVMRPRTR